MPEEYEHDDSDTPEECDYMGPEAESSQDIAAAVEYGERFEAFQVTVRKVRAARRLIELAGGYKEAVVEADAVWFADEDRLDAAKSVASTDAVTDDDSDSECEPDYEAWVARARKVIAAENLLQLASGYSEALLLLDTALLVLRGEEAYEQVTKVRGAAAAYHQRTAATLRRKADNERNR